MSAKKVSSSLNLDFDNLVKLLAERFQVTKCSLMLLDVHKGDKVLVVRASVGMNRRVAPTVKMKPARSAVGNLADIGEGILVENIEHDPRYKRKSKSRYSSKSFICVPIKNSGRIYGLLSLTDKKVPPHCLTKPDLIELCTLATYLFKDFEHQVYIKSK